MKNEQLREEFAETFGLEISVDEPRKRVIYSMKGKQVADWWIQKMEEALSHQKAELRLAVSSLEKRVSSRSFNQYLEDTEIAHNKAIEEVLSLL